MALRQIVWHPAVVIGMLCLAFWELLVAPSHATPFDLICAPLCITWMLLAAHIYRKDGKL